MPFVFDFDHTHPRPPMELKDLLGGKGANLAEMTSVLELPVPPGFTISTDACRAYMTGGWPKELDAEVAAARARLETAMGKVIGDAGDPLLVSVRSGAKFSMPGMMDTVLNLGLNDESVEGLAKQTGDERFAFDSYRRFIAMYARIVLELPGEEFDSLFDAAKELAGTTSDAKVPTELLRYLVDSYQQIVERHTGKPFPQKPVEQLRGAIEAVFRSWNGPRAIAYRERERIAHDLGTAVNVQAMVFGNRDDNSGTGVGFTRDPATGAKGAYGDFLVNAQGEDVVAGIRNTEPISELKKQFPKVHAELLEIFARLEGHYADMCDTEFTIEQGKLWMLQTRVGKRTGAAALKMAVDMVRPSDLGISKVEAVSRITEDHLDSVLHPQFADSGYATWAKGLGASPGAAVGRIYFTANDAAAAAERGEPVILVRNETSPEDVHGMLASEGILTARGGLVSHAAVVARGWGKPAVVGAEVLRLGDHQVTAHGVTIYEADWVSLDGGAGIVVAGQVPLTAAKPPAAFDTVLSWADAIRKGHLAVRANADTGDDAANAPTSAQRASACAAPSTCSWARTACPWWQLRGAIEAVFRSWNGPRAIAYRDREHIAHDLGTAVNVQAMVYGNTGDTSGSGVAFTRNPANGTNEFYGEFLINAQGEDVVAGVRTPEPISELKKQVPQGAHRAARRSSAGSRRTTRTCATPSSPSTRASSGCCRPGWASAPGPPR